MTDAEKLCLLAKWFENPDDEIDISWDEAPIILRRIADLLDAVPPETLEAIMANKVRLMGPEPPEISITITQAHQMSPLDWYKLWWLAAAPAKPEE